MFHRRAAGLERRQARLYSPPAVQARLAGRNTIERTPLWLLELISPLYLTWNTPRPVPLNTSWWPMLLVLPGVGELNLNNFDADFIANFAGTFVSYCIDVTCDRYCL